MRSLLVVFAALIVAGCNCNKSECSPGASSCACNAGACNDGLVCSADNVCVVPGMVGIQVSDAAARGCEVLLAEGAGTVVSSATFDSSVVGTYLREAPRVAVTFVAAKDSTIGSGGVQLALASGTAAGVTVTKATCVDARGAALPNATVSIR